MLVDTTVWVDFFRGKHTSQVCMLEKLIERQDDIYCCGVVLTEVLQGILNEKQSRLVKSRFNTLLYVEMTRDIYINAADIYIKLRQKGITVRKTIDCLIAAVSISYNLPLLHKDKDFLPIERYCGLRSALP